MLSENLFSHLFLGQNIWHKVKKSSKISLATKSTSGDINGHLWPLVLPNILTSISPKKSFVNVINTITLFIEALQFNILIGDC